jgi:YggT family protein
MLAIHNVSFFLISLFFSLCIFVILLRILLQFFRANVNNPICLMVAKLSNPLVLPLRRILPRVSSIDLASILVLLLVEIFKFVVFSFLQGLFIGWIPCIIMSITDILVQIINILFYAIIIRVILSWVQSPSTAYLAEVAYVMTEPLLGKIRRVVPIIGGMDLSPLIAFVLLKVISIVILSYLPG